MSKQKLISVEEAKKLEINEVKKFYENYISKSQVNFFSNFVFGNEIIDTAEGSYLTSGNKKILDLTGGIGVLNHGHNHQNILRERINFQKEKEWRFISYFFLNILLL